MTQALTLDLPSYHTNEWYTQPQLKRAGIAEAVLSYIGTVTKSGSLNGLVTREILLDSYHTQSLFQVKIEVWHL